jgi:GNAT superfamily N-acetyltransferase
MSRPVIDRVLVREATVEDAAALATLRWEHCYELGGYPGAGGETLDREEFDAEFAAFLRETLDGGQWAVWLAEADGAAVGTISVQRVAAVPTPWQTTRGWGYVTSVQVAPDWRGRGVGRLLMNAALAWAREGGLELVHLWPSPDSVAFYRAVGFSPAVSAMELWLGA